ncbi:MAG: glycosyltransferase [Lachnospiraceae bacterium]|nr:glycosyltransferase [Lachnospiraceae bacterium]
MSGEEAYKLQDIKCDVLVIQFYEFATVLDESLIRDRKVVYVIHSVPTPEPPPTWDPFGGNDDIRWKFERLCDIADVLVCVSKAEKEKLSRIYPQYEDKIEVVYNGITYDVNCDINRNYLNGRHSVT